MSASSDGLKQQDVITVLHQVVNPVCTRDDGLVDSQCSTWLVAFQLLEQSVDAQWLRQFQWLVI
jgi:hypothetical protein